MAYQQKIDASMSPGDPIEFTIKRLLTLLEPYDKVTGTEKQIDLAKRAGVNQGTISKWADALKAGKVPKLEGLVALAKGLGVPLASLFPQDEASGPLVGRNFDEPAGGLSPEIQEVIAILQKDPKALDVVRMALRLKPAKEIKDIRRDPAKKGPNPLKP
jgi:transcriptional regulator with XRE-family HTH domain